MRDQFVPYEIALKLKEKGFNENCFGWYSDTGNLNIRPNVAPMDCHKDNCVAPIWQQVTQWLMEKHDHYIVIIGDKETEFEFVLSQYQKVRFATLYPRLNSYQEALKAAVEKALELI